MVNITISREEYESLLRKAQKLDELQGQKNYQKKTNNKKISDELKEEIEMWQRASGESIALFNKKHNL